MTIQKFNHHILSARILLLSELFVNEFSKSSRQFDKTSVILEATVASGNAPVSIPLIVFIYPRVFYSRLCPGAIFSLLQAVERISRKATKIIQNPISGLYASLSAEVIRYDTGLDEALFSQSHKQHPVATAYAAGQLK